MGRSRSALHSPQQSGHGATADSAVAISETQYACAVRRVASRPSWAVDGRHSAVRTRHSGLGAMASETRPNAFAVRRVSDRLSWAVAGWQSVLATRASARRQLTCAVRRVAGGESSLVHFLSFFEQP